MSWYSTGTEAADTMAASAQTRRTKNFFTKPGESARIRFLSSAAESFNYKRGFVSWAKGQKLLTSPGTQPDPFVEAGISLQVAFAWKIVDRRVLKFNDRTTNEEKEVGPRLLYFADGTRTRKQLIAFEKEVLSTVNEERAEEGKDPLELKELNLSHYDIKVSKEKGAPWNFVAMRPKTLSKEDKELIEKNDFELLEELKPLSLAELKGVLTGGNAQQETAQPREEETSYSYSDDEDESITFED